MIYGASGYTGRLIVARALEVGLRPLLAGRDPAALEALASESGLEARPLGLDRAGELDAGLEGVRAVLHCAGPFVHTAGPMVDACLRRGVHYLDITGEISVFEALIERDEAAATAGVVLLPGVGFDVVPTDCLAAHLVRRLPSADRLVLAFRSTGGVSRGTALSALEQLGRTRTVRRGERRVRVPVGHRRRVDFGRGPRTVVAIPWGDLATAPWSTGVADVEVYTGLSWIGRTALRASRVLGPLLRSRALRALARAWLRRRPSGPDSLARARGRSVIWGEVEDRSGRRATARLYGPEGYTFTARTSVAALRRVLADDPEPGFRTPSQAFGADFVLEIEGVRRQDLGGALPETSAAESG